jgi:hypothetical protein
VIRDPEIRAALHALLDRRMPAGSVVIDEYGLHGSVADVAVLTPHALHGFEIKSDADNTRRLASQIRGYGRFVTTATLVAGPKILPHCLKAVPKWWGVLRADRCSRCRGAGELQDTFWLNDDEATIADVRCDDCGGAKLTFHIVRQVQPNPEQDKLKVAHLLWGAEAQTELRERGIRPKGRLSVGWKHALAEHLTLDELRAVIHENVAAREWIARDAQPRTIGLAA